jgi:hypothetical protein
MKFPLLLLAIILLTSCVSSSKIDYNRLHKKQNEIKKKHGDYILPDALSDDQLKQLKID